MHRDHTIINQKQRNKLQREQVPRTPTQSWRRKHQMSLRSQKQTTPKSPSVQEDTLSSSSSSEELPMGLL